MPLPVSLPAFHHPLGHSKNYLSPLLPATSKTSQESNISGPLTPFFSANRHHSSSVFFTLEKISLLFSATSQNTPGYTPYCPALHKTAGQSTACQNIAIPVGYGLYLEPAEESDRLYLEPAEESDRLYLEPAKENDRLNLEPAKKLEHQPLLPRPVTPSLPLLCVSATLW